jgi:hypothetical protein
MTMDGDGDIYLLTKSGDTIVVRADPSQFVQVATNSLGETSNASVVIANGSVLVRTDSALWSFGRG